MKKRIKALLKGELIGKEVAIADAANSCNIGICGTIVDETMHTLVIDTGCRRKRLQKKGVTFQFRLMGRMVNVKGDMLEQRPEERIRMKV